MFEGLERENATLRAQLAGIGKERDDLRRENEALRLTLGNQPAAEPSYDDGDTIKCWRKNLGFLTDPRFLSALQTRREFRSRHAGSGRSPALRYPLGGRCNHGNWDIVRWPRLSEQIFRLDKWSLCRG